MAGLIILSLAGLVCVSAILVALFILLKNKDSEEFIVACIVAMLICGGAAAWCATEALKRADIYDKANK